MGVITLLIKGLITWGFSARVELSARESSSQASYKILVKRSLRLHEENFSPGCWAETSAEMRFLARLIGLKFPHVISKIFQPRLKIHKRMRRTLVYNNKYKKQRFPLSVSARAEISHVIAFFFSARAEILHEISP